MTPEERKKKKRTRILRVAVPVLLAGAFASLSLLESGGVFASVNKPKAPAPEHPAAVPVAFTGLSVMNRLENDGFSRNGTQLMRHDTEAGTLELSGGEEIDSLCYSLVLLPEDESPAGNTVSRQREADLENARLVFHAVLEAVLGGEAPKEKLLTQGEKKLDRCLTGKGDKTETLALPNGSLTFEKVTRSGLCTLKITAQRQAAE